MIRRITFAVVASFALMPSLVIAQAGRASAPEYNGTSRIPERAKTADVQESRAYQKIVGACVYREHPDLAVRLLQSSNFKRIDYDQFGHSKEEFADTFSLQDCLEEAMRANQSKLSMALPVPALRAALVEEAYLARHAEPMKLPEGAPEVLDYSFHSSLTPEPSETTFAAVGDCAVAADPVNTDVLIRTTPASDEELAAAKSLVNALGNCVPLGSEVKFTPLSIRLMVADGLWARSRNLESLGSQAPGTNEEAAE